MKRFIPKCKHCGKASWAKVHDGRDHEFEFAPEVERKPRLTVETPWAGDYQARVLLDERLIYLELGYTFEQEARAAAEAYKAELLAHFRSGGE